ncbi:hypothetical protein DB313_04760 (plasmid) [Borrelia turcica IST7]|uniref:Lipoprotein n=1 Tax=Borrelia turcica IST7 TaxID=1104446 RepID=A0A386PP72_9SPIR|nr:hypothetical protein [Borrelia turcica]AYE36813.1 hypothetical protein DB313_04760 [Borrelia turcica IST7]
MRIGNILLISLFVSSLFISCKSSHKEIEKVVIEYASNSGYAGSVNLNLENDYDSFSLKYDLFAEYSSIEAQFKGDELLVKDIRFNGSEVCILPDSDMTVYKLDELWAVSVGVDLERCMGGWKEMASKAGEKDLFFSIVAVNKGSGVEKNYSFKVSPKNLISFIESVELVNPDGFSSNVS